MPSERRDRRPSLCLAGGAVLAIALAGPMSGCAKPSPVPDVLTQGQEVWTRIDDPHAVDPWSVRTSSERDVAVLRLAGKPDEIGMLRVQVLLAGGVVVARLDLPKTDRFSIALSGRGAQWAVEFSLAERGSGPVRYSIAVGRPATPPAGERAPCAEALGARGIDAWIVSVPGLTDGGLLFPGLGTLALRAAPAGAVTVGSPMPDAPPVARVRGGTTLHGDFASLGCEPHEVQVNLWDTGNGKPPALTTFDASGRPLCGRAGQPSCPANPTAGRWVTWTLAGSAPIHRMSLECDDLYLSSIVIR
jgi:hypothetical protein